MSMEANSFVFMVKENHKKKNSQKDRSQPRMYDLEGYRRRVDSVIFRNEDREEVRQTFLLLQRIILFSFFSRYY